MTRWDYLVLQAEAELAEAGQAGWELVSVVAGPAGTPRFYLKRPAQSFQTRITLEQKRHAYQHAGIARTGQAGS